MDRILGYFRGLEKLLPPAPQSNNNKGQKPQVENYSLRETFYEADSYISFLENVFTNLDGKEYRICLNHDGSVLIERILLATKVAEEEGEEWSTLDTAFYLRVFVDRLVGRYAEMAKHMYASHVVQTILKLLTWHKDSKSEDQGELPTVSQLVDTLCKELLNGNVFCDPYGSHVARDLLDTLYTFSKECDIDEMVERLAFDSHGSLVLQHYVQLASKSFELSDECIESGLRHHAASRFLEVHMQATLTTSSSFHTFYSKYMRGKLHELLLDPIANHIIRTLIRMAHAEHQVTLIMKEIESFDFVKENRILVLVSLVDWVNSNQTSSLAEQVGKFVFDAFGLKSTLEKKATFTTILLNENSQINPNGAQLLTCLAKLDCEKHTKCLFDSLLHIEAERFVEWSKDKIASRSLEAFICSKSSSRTRLIKKFTNHFASLASDRIASHIVEKCYFAADVELKTSILAELAIDLTRLRADSYGKFVIRNCRVEEYARKSDDWKKKEESKERKRKVLQEVIEEDDPTTPFTFEPLKSVARTI